MRVGNRRSDLILIEGDNIVRQASASGPSPRMTAATNRAWSEMVVSRDPPALARVHRWGSSGDSVTSRPWSEPGGDVEEWNGVEAFVSKGRNEGSVRFDVTEIIRQRLNEDTRTEDFVLVAVGLEREGLLPQSSCHRVGRFRSNLRLPAER